MGTYSALVSNPPTSLCPAKNKKPHLFYEKWGSKSPYYTFPPSKGIGERISMGMITE
jgi:hypothetical protein